MKLNGRVALLGLATLAPSIAAQGPTYFNYLNGKDYPADSNPGFHEDVQGLTHDDNNWYFSQTWDVWKVPVMTNLDQDLDGVPGVLHRDLDDFPAFDDYSHCGDIGYANGFVFLPLTQTGQPPLLVALDASDLSLVDFEVMPLRR